jgi:hypothetical protein
MFAVQRAKVLKKCIALLKKAHLSPTKKRSKKATPMASISGEQYT